MALNFQTACQDMDLNQGRFLVNGKSGYILKPAFMREEGTDFDPITLTRGDWLKHKTLHVMVLVQHFQWFPVLQSFLFCNCALRKKDHVISYMCPPSVIRSYQHSSSPKWTIRNPPSWTRWLKCRCSECQLMLLKKRHLLLKTMVPFLSNTIYMWFVQYLNAVYMKQILAMHVFLYFWGIFSTFYKTISQTQPM